MRCWLIDIKSPVLSLFGVFMRIEDFNIDLNDEDKAVLAEIKKRRNLFRKLL
jgi:hypothetical protein